MKQLLFFLLLPVFAFGQIDSTGAEGPKCDKGVYAGKLMYNTEFDKSMSEGVITQRDDDLMMIRYEMFYRVEQINTTDRNGEVSYHGEDILIFKDGEFHIVGENKVLEPPAQMCNSRMCKFCYPNNYYDPLHVNYGPDLFLSDRKIFVSEDPKTGEIIIRLQKRER